MACFNYGKVLNNCTCINYKHDNTEDFVQFQKKRKVSGQKLPVIWALLEFATIL